MPDKNKDSNIWDQYIGDHNDWGNSSNSPSILKNFNEVDVIKSDNGENIGWRNQCSNEYRYQRMVNLCRWILMQSR